jgi:excisionase family DNA binding protein
VLSVKQAAERLGVSMQTVYVLRAAHRLRHSRVGLSHGAIRIPEDAIAEYLKAGEAPRIESAMLRDELLALARHLEW